MQLNMDTVDGLFGFITHVFQQRPTSQRRALAQNITYLNARKWKGIANRFSTSAPVKLITEFENWRLIRVLSQASLGALLALQLAP